MVQLGLKYLLLLLMKGFSLFILLSSFHLIAGYNGDQVAFLKAMITSNIQNGRQGVDWKATSFVDEHVMPVLFDLDTGSAYDDLIVGGLPGQPSDVKFKQFAGDIVVDEAHGRHLFYYFVEAAHEIPTSKPLVLWLNGGPGCSSVGIGAFTEHGPFGVKRDGRTLYSRSHSWNKVANILYLESPAGVGFSYSNTSSDYEKTGDSSTARDSLVFLLKWFKRFPHYRTTDFYIAGESYAGYYIPELVDLIQSVAHIHPSAIKVKGIMIGNGLLDVLNNFKGTYDYMWSHALISDSTYRGLTANCLGVNITPTCLEFERMYHSEVGQINLYCLYCLDSQSCNTNSTTKCESIADPCERRYVSMYLNLPQVQRSLHANKTKLPYAWGVCSSVITNWRDNPSTVLPLYQKLFTMGLQILFYSGDMDAVIPVTATRYAINTLNLTIKNHWRPWLDGNNMVGGYRVDYDGLTFATVRGAGHEVPRYRPYSAFSLFKGFLEEY